MFTKTDRMCGSYQIKRHYCADRQFQFK